MAPCYSQKTDLWNEATFSQFNAFILEPIHFQVGAILEQNALENSLFVLV